MILLKTVIKDSLSTPLEEYFCDCDCVSWGIEKINDKTPPELFGYFETEEEARNAYDSLLAAFPELGRKYSIESVNDCDWKNEYKKFLTAWHFENLHWVPVWMRGDYLVPAGDKVIYFDAGLAFGTGDHPTTRLCAMAIADYAKFRGAEVSKDFIVDAGCGSGILALSAKLLGFGNVFGFDRDEEAVRVSLENARFNGIELSNVEFVHAGIEKALAGRSAEIVVANIISDVLCIYADTLLGAVKSGGTLVLSGILAEENAATAEYFKKRGAEKIVSCESMTMGDWSRLVIKMK